MPESPLPEPEHFERAEWDKAVTIEAVHVAINESKTRVMLALVEPDSGISFVFPTTSAGARQLAAYILNKADMLDEEN